MGSHCIECGEAGGPRNYTWCADNSKCRARTLIGLRAATELAWRAIVERDAARAELWATRTVLHNMCECAKCGGFRADGNYPPCLLKEAKDSYEQRAWWATL